MVKYDSKVVRLTSDTLNLIEDYRSWLKIGIENNNIIKNIDKMSYDNIISCAFSDILFKCNKE